MNAVKDPWTDAEIRSALSSADIDGGPPIELMVYFIGLLQRMTIALETIAKSDGPEYLFRENAQTARECPVCGMLAGMHMPDCKGPGTGPKE